MGMVSHYTCGGVIFNYYIANWYISKDIKGVTRCKKH